MAKQQRFDPQAIDRARGAAPAKVSPSGKRPSGTKTSAKKGPVKPPAAKVPPATFGDWVSASRPATLGLAIAPVAVGTGAATLSLEPWYEQWVLALLCLAVAVFLQVGVNYANDYSDGIRGTDAHRVGPARLVGSGRARPAAVRNTAFVFFGLAAVAGLAIVVLTQLWWLLAVGAAAIVAAWFYTGGRRPYGYSGLGEVMVFLFFGLVAVLGTAFVQIQYLSLEAWLGAIAIGLFAVAVLHVNNLRDREQDRVAGKRTFSVRIGDRASRIVYVVFVLLPFVILAFFAIFYVYAPYVYFTLLSALPACLIVLTARSAREYVLALKLTLLTAVLFGLGLGAAIAF